MSDFEPHDWKRTSLPKLAQLDSLQRCLICKDFLKAPVITSCNHTFCSQCIRQHLMNTSRCPLCKAEQFESNLKRVILLEEIVLCFQSLREELISLVKDREEAHHLPHHESEGSSDNASDGVEVIEILDDSRAQSSSPISGQQRKLEPGYVHCPVCEEVMKEEHVQGSHLDYCLNGKPDPKLAVRDITPKRKAKDVISFFQSRKRQSKTKNEFDHEKFYFEKGDQHHHEAKRIPKIDFASLSTTKVKEKLSALKLSTSGSRTELEWRYNQYYLLHQSNLDSNHPLSEIQLRQKLKQVEVSYFAAPSTTALNTIYGDSLSRKNLSDKDFPIKAWLDLYKDDFKQLIRKARKSRKPRILPPAEIGATSKGTLIENSVNHEDAISDIRACEKGDHSLTRGDSELSGMFDFSKSALFAPE